MPNQARSGPTLRPRRHNAAARRDTARHLDLYTGGAPEAAAAASDVREQSERLDLVGGRRRRLHSQRRPPLRGRAERLLRVLVRVLRPDRPVVLGGSARESGALVRVRGKGQGRS